MSQNLLRMKGLIFASFLFLSLSSSAQDQTKTSKPPSSPAQVYNGYLIKLNSLVEGGYGYGISYHGKPVVSQKLNPFTLSPKGLSRQEDAFKVARWQVEQLAAGTPPSAIAARPLPSPLAKQLNIAVE